MGEHTKVPWYVATRPEADVDEVVQTGARSFSMTGGYTGNDEYDRDMGIYAVVDGWPETIATPWNEANARFIVLACNHHDELVRELKKVIDYHEYVQRNCIWHLEANAQVDLVQMLNDLRSFLARIEEASRG